MRREQAVLWVMLTTVLVIVVAWRGSRGGSRSSTDDEPSPDDPQPASVGAESTRIVPPAHEPTTADAPPAEETPEPGAPVQPKRKRGAPRVLWHGRVIDALAHEPLAGAALASRGSASETAAARATSGDDGRLPPVEVDGQLLRVVRPGYSPALVWIQPGHETVESELVIALAEAATVEVTLEDPSKVMRSGATVRVRADEHDTLVQRDESAQRAAFWADLQTLEWTAPIGPEGTCIVGGLPAGVALELELVPRGGRLRVWPERPQLRPGEHRALTWVIGEGCRLGGRALDADGGPAEGLELVLFGEENAGAQHRTTTDASGNFVFEDVLPAKWWIGLAGSAQFVADPMPVEIVTGETEKTVEFPVVRGLFLRGTVVDRDGRPAAKCLVGARQGGIGEHRWESESDARGAFAIGPLAAGDYRLRAELWDSGANLVAASPEMEVSAGADGLVLELERRKR